MHSLASSLGFIALGFVTGTYGTLIGAGGGFVLMPLLLVLYPTEDPTLLTSISLAVVFFNAASGSEAYARMHRVDYRSGLYFALAAVPGAVIGAAVTNFVPRAVFDGIFGAMMVAGSLFLFLRKPAGDKTHSCVDPGNVRRTLTDKEGVTYEYCYRLRTGVVLSFFVGFLSSFLGIGGGIIHVPALVYLLNFPVHIATATSHFILAIMALAGTMEHVVSGAFVHGIHRTIYLALGVLAGAQVGAHLSARIRGRRIIQSLALALAFAGLRILYQAFTTAG